MTAARASITELKLAVAAFVWLSLLQFGVVALSPSPTAAPEAGLSHMHPRYWIGRRRSVVGMAFDFDVDVDFPLFLWLSWGSRGGLNATNPELWARGLSPCSFGPRWVRRYRFSLWVAFRFESRPVSETHLSP